MFSYRNKNLEKIDAKKFPKSATRKNKSVVERYFENKTKYDRN